MDKTGKVDNKKDVCPLKAKMGQVPRNKTETLYF